MDPINPSDDPLVLFGAGASVPAGIPTALGMVAKVIDLCRTERNPLYLRALMAIIGALQMGVGQDEPQPAAGYISALPMPEYPDIEQVMNAAVLLGDRLNLEFAPFVAAWHPIIEQIERRSFTSYDAQQIASRSVRLSSPIPSTSEHALHRWIEENLQKTLDRAFGELSIHLSYRPNGDLFRSLGGYLTRKLVDLTWLRDPGALAHLDPLLNAARTKPITVVTLNYDNGVELRAAHLGIQCETGLDTWSRTGELPPSLASGVSLLKLHGSVKWWWKPKNRTTSNSLHYREISELTDDKIDAITKDKSPSSFTPRLGVIFGGHNKLTAEGPFLDILTKFREETTLHSHLVIIGYSFRDDHVNQNIARWLHRTSDTCRVTVIDKPGASEVSNPLYENYKAVLGDRLQFLPIGTAEAIAKIFPP